MKFNKSAIYVSDRPNEVKYANCSSEKARKLLNYKTSVNLEEELYSELDTKYFDY